MKICYARLNDDVGVSPLLNKGQGIEHRQGFLHALVEQGHDVTIVSPIRGKEKSLLKIRSLTGSNWYNKLKYDIRADGSQFECFILESGSNNVRYTRGTSEGPEVNILGLNVERLKQFRGKVFLWHHIYSFNVIFPFGAIFDNDGVSQRQINHKKPVGELAEEIWSRLFDNFDPFEGKEWTILHHCLDEESFKKVGGRYGFTYGQLPKLKYKYIHLPVSKLDTYIPTVKANPEWDSLYIGSRYSHSTFGHKDHDRLANVKKFYDTPLYKAGIIGEFERDEKIERLEHTSIINDGGSNIPLATAHWNDSLTSIFTESEACLDVGAITGRTFLCLQGGSILLLDKALSNVHKLNLGAYEVADAKEASEWIKVIKDWSPQKRDEIRRQQLSTFPVWENIPWEEILTGKKDPFDFSDSKLNVGSYTPILHQRNNDYV